MKDNWQQGTLVVMSDIHLEFTKIAEPDIDSIPSANYLALCGDIGVGMSARPFIEKLIASKKWETIFLVLGNHEFYGKVIEDVEIKWEMFAEEQGDSFVFLNGQKYFEHNGFLFIGCTLWTDLSNPRYSSIATYMMNDYKLIRSIRSFDNESFDKKQENFDITKPDTWAHSNCAKISYVDGYSARPRTITTELTTYFHNRDVEYITTGLSVAQEWGLTPIVLTHHTPSVLCLSKAHSGSLDPAYFTNLEPLLSKVRLWACGHTHNRLDEVVNGCRLVMNCKGYIHNGKEELPGFKAKVVEL